MTSEKCATCLRTIRQKQQKLECATCSKAFHRTCMDGITQDDYRAWRKEGTLETWTCCTETTTAPASPTLTTSTPPPTTPQPLDPLTVSKVGTDFILLAWKPYPTVGPGSLYTVTYKERGQEVAQLSSNQIFELGEFLMCKVESLRADTEYMFYVDVAAGSGLSAQLTTEDFVKTSSLWVLPLRVEEIGGNHVTLTWRETPANPPSSPEALSHVITYQEKGSEAILTCPSPVSKLGVFNLCKVGSLAPSTEYQFFVEVVDGGVKQKYATTDWIRTKAAVVLPLRVEEVGEKHVTLRWTATTPTTSPSSIVTYTEKGKDTVLTSLSRVSRLGGFNVCKVDSLAPNTEYYFFIEDDNGNGAWQRYATTHAVRTKAAVAAPSAPVGPLKASNICHDSLVLSWQPPVHDGNCRPISYKVAYTRKDLSPQEPVPVKAMSRQEGGTLEYVAYKIGSLVPSTDYMFYVRARNIVGDSEPLTSEMYISTDKIPTPLIGPLFVRHETSGIGTLRVWWPLLNEKIHRVDKYVVKASWNNSNPANHADWHTVTETEDCSVNTVRIANQFPQSYWIGVAAVNSSGPGPLSVVRVNIRAPVKAPSPVTVEPSGPGKTKVTWNSLDPNVFSVAKYIVKASLDKASWNPIITTGNADTSVIIDNPFDKTHWIGVAAANDAGTGPLTMVIREIKEPVAENQDMPDLPFFKVLEELVPVQDIDFDKKRSYNLAIPVKHKVKGALHRLQDGLKIQLRICLKRGSNSARDEMPRNGLLARVDKKTVWPDTTNIDLTKKKILAEPLDITRAVLTSADPKLWLSPVGNKDYGHKGHYCFCVRLVQELTADDLCDRLLKEKVRPAQKTRDEVKAQLSGEGDCEIAATSVHASLLCPIAKTKLRYPCRSTFCSHVQCLDAVTMVTLNSKKNCWSCQVCSKVCKYEDLYIDGLFKEILATVPADINEVEFSKDGSWTFKGDKSEDKENTAPEELDMSIIELDLSKTLDMIDLTETDEESTPLKKKDLESNNINRPSKVVSFKLGNGDKSVGDKFRSDRPRNGSENENRQPLRTNNIILNAAFRVGQSLADFLGIGGERDSRGLGENYQSSDLNSCHRNSSSTTNNRHHSRWSRSNRPYDRSRDWYHNRYNSSSYRNNSGGGSSYRNREITDYYYSDSRNTSNSYYRLQY